jgi:hypothetical protein
MLPMADSLADATTALAVLTGVLAVATVVLAGITHCGIKRAGKDAVAQITAMRETADAEVKAKRWEFEVLLLIGPRTWARRRCG